MKGEAPHDDDRTTLDDGLRLTLMTAACGSSDAPGTYSTEESPAPIKRRPTPVTDFTPVELEATIMATNIDAYDDHLDALGVNQ
ncbi:hypothetical protein BE17_30965 [Sorangium cellulosum]|uniref:Uncharacterized protein n=1 Tax=Sorangium cellulosum TaxID=56 RepID=A0A150RGJ7_SORCE|nr:hypothetical protein BE17_30965 [Sorangium cellulosum]